MNSLKASLLSLMLVLTLAIFAISCSNPLSNARDSKPSDTTLNLDDAAAVLRAIKLPELVLPKSLQDGTESSGGARHVARAYGDISDLTSMPLPSLKSSRYLELKDTLARGSQSQMFLGLFKDYANSNPMPIGQDFELQTFSFDFGWGNPMEWVKPGKMRIVRTRSDELSYYWSMSYPLDHETFSDPDSELRIPIYLVLIVKNSGKLEMLVYAPDFNGGEFMQMYDSYDPATNRGITIQNSNANISYFEFFKSSDGSVQAYSKYFGKNGDGFDNEGNWVAYGNDLYGGYFSSHAGTFSDGNGGQTSYRSANVDYYDQNGNLIAQGWGQQEPQAWMSKYGLNIKNVPGAPSNAPETFKIKWITGSESKFSR